MYVSQHNVYKQVSFVYVLEAVCLQNNLLAKEKKHMQAAVTTEAKFLTVLDISKNIILFIFDCLRKGLSYDYFYV